MHLHVDLKNNSSVPIVNDENRIIYIVLFISFLIISIISTALIYYFVRHKKKSFFDAAGRKYIESLGDYDMLLEIFEKIIRNDEKESLEAEVISKNNKHKFNKFYILNFFIFLNFRIIIFFNF